MLGGVNGVAFSFPLIRNMAFKDHTLCRFLFIVLLLDIVVLKAVAVQNRINSM